MKDICVGVDVGGTSVKLGLFRIDGKLISSFEILTRKEEKGKYIIGDIAAAIENGLDEQAIEKSRVVGVGIGVPGPVLDDGTVNNCVNLGWGVINIVEELEKLIHLPVKAGNDATVAALGEMWQGGGKGYDSLVLFTLGTGVGGGIVMNNKPINGEHGAGGEIGHMHVVYDETENCSCGKKGCLEQVASATGIVKETKKLLANSNEASTLRDYDNITAKVVFDEAKNGDRIACKAVDILGKYLGIAMANVAGVVDPAVFAIGGGVSKAGPILIEAVEKYFKEYSFHACRNTRIVLAELGNDAGIYGAARLVIED